MLQNVDVNETFENKKVIGQHLGNKIIPIISLIMKIVFKSKLLNQDKLSFSFTLAPPAFIFLEE